MADSPRIIVPHGGYRQLIPFQKSDIIYQGTVIFCERFLPQYGDRTVDQMIQAARSCKQNIAEGSDASGTSKETEIKLTNVARASLAELQEDYLDFLKKNGSLPWPINSRKIIAIREYSKTHINWDDWKHYFDSRPAETLCNIELTLIHQTRFLLDKLLAYQESDFKNNGGIRERMSSARSVTRAENWSKNIYSYLLAASDAIDLSNRVATIRIEIERIANKLRNENSWQ